jgi:hypothetical protein
MALEDKFSGFMSCGHISQRLIAMKEDCAIWFSNPEGRDILEWHDQPLPVAGCLFREDEVGAWVGAWIAFANTEKNEGEDIRLAGFSYAIESIEEFVYGDDIKLTVGKATDPGRAILAGGVTCQTFVICVYESGKGHNAAEAQKAFLNLAGFMKENFY